MVMSVYTPDSSKDTEEYEKFIKEATTILQERRRAGAKVFDIAGDFNMELGMLRRSARCTDLNAG